MKTKRMRSEPVVRALCVQDPWASLIAAGLKTLEVRSWSTPYRGPVVIVVSRTWSRHPASSRWRDAYFNGPRGVTLCLVDLVDVRPGRSSDSELTGGIDPTGNYVWELRKPRPVCHEKVKGHLNLWRLQLQIRFAS